MRRRQNYHYLLLHQQRPWHRSLHAVYTPCRGRMGGPGHLSETQDPEFNHNSRREERKIAARTTAPAATLAQATD